MSGTWYIPWYVYPFIILAGLTMIGAIVVVGMVVAEFVRRRREGGDEREYRATIRNLETKLEVAEVRERRLKTLVNELREGQNNYGKISP